MKKQFFALACLGLALTGCGQQAATTSQPETTVITIIETPSATQTTAEQSPTSAVPTTVAAEQTTAPTPTSDSAAPTETPIQMISEPTETPVKALQMPDETDYPRFAGTTLKGNDVYFVIFPQEVQESIKNFSGAVNLTGSWGSLCSNMATHNQLKETAIETYLSDMVKTWYSYDYAFTFSGKNDEQLAATKTKILEASNQYSSGYAACKPFYSGYNDAASYAYTGAEVGQFNVDLPTTNKAPLNKL